MKYRIIELKDGNGESFYRLQVKRLGIWWTCLIYHEVPDGLVRAEFLDLAAARQELKERLSGVTDFANPKVVK